MRLKETTRRPLNIKTRTFASNCAALREELDTTSLLARVLSSRGVVKSGQIELSLERLLSPNAIPDIERAANRVVAAIKQNEHIVIAGDYDTDGATSSALCVSFLAAVGAKHVDFQVPDRFKLGYGFSAAFANTLVPLHPDLVITVDNGISSQDGVQVANDHGIDVIITDHHLPPSVLPAAYAIVNPNLPNCEFKSQPAGVGVAFYLMTVVRSLLDKEGYFDGMSYPKPRMTDYLDLVAIGTVADLVPLDQNNRILVHQGIRRVRSGIVRLGIQALCRSAGVDPSTLTTEDIGFRLAPRLNSAGRMDDIAVGIRMLLVDDRNVARSLAEQLNALNSQRRVVQEGVTELVQLALRNSTSNGATNCVYDAKFHEGVVGLVANRVVERTGLPTAIFTDAENTEMLIKGSVRSIASIHIRDVLAEIHSRAPKLLVKFGGHAMAAGLTIRKTNFKRFTAFFEQTIKDHANAATFEGITESDGELDLREFELATVDEIERFGPWGQQFSQPVFHGTFMVVSERLVGNGRHLRLVVKKNDMLFDAIAFNEGMLHSDKVLLVFHLARNKYRGTEKLELFVEKLEAA